MKETYQTIFETTGTAMVVYGPDMVITLANKEFEKLSGYSAAELEGKISLIQFVAPENVEQVKADHQLRLSTPLEAPRNAEFHFVGRSGEIIDVYLTVATVPGKKASVLSLMDITERKKNERFRIKSEERYRTLFEDSHDAIVITAPDGRFVDVNKACRHLFQYTKDELMAMTAEALYKNPLDRKKILEEIASTHSVRDYEVKLCKKDRTVMDCHMTVTVWHDDQENVLGYQAIIRDITEKKRAEETIWRLAYHDSLTGLPNRLLFLDRLDVAIARAYRNEKKLAIMMLDLDRFKDVNDSLGHNIGDRLLQVSGKRLKSTIRQGDTVSRIGGDEFMLLITEIGHIKDASMVARKIIRSFHEPFEFDEHRISITTSIGIAIYPNDGDNADTLIKHADIAMYGVKAHGRNNYKRFNPSMISSVVS